MVASTALLLVSTPLAWAGIALGVLGAIGGGIPWATRRLHRSGPLIRLRAAPTALPASDALVARLCAQLPAAAPDVRETVGELALLVQRLMDHRAERAHPGAGQAELEVLAGPVAPLTDLVCAAIAALAAIDAELRGLDEGALVRALAASEARGETRTRRLELLEGLERLRTLEEQRGQHLSRLLEAISLLERACQLALGAAEADASYEREVRLALASLE